ncbi:MAG: Sec-independent protein translocase protein TatAy [Chlamydiales bacterium]|nr:Sec-independent protein translocase protein TatAy [Chlamydiales bacterium]
MIGGWELILVLFVVLVLFGGKRLPEFARSLGKGLREFKKASQGIDEEEEKK